MEGGSHLQAQNGEEGNKAIKRRSFLNYWLGVSLATFGGFSAYALARYLFPPGLAGAEAAGEDVRIMLSELPVGTAKVFRYKGEPSVAVRTGEKAVRVLSAVCPHLGCIVKWDSGKSLLVCPCHAAVFDVNGNVVSGPAPRPLASYPARIVQDEVIVGET